MMTLLHARTFATSADCHNGYIVAKMGEDTESIEVGTAVVRQWLERHDGDDADRVHAAMIHGGTALQVGGTFG